jgi:hypothetical protein
LTALYTPKQNGMATLYGKVRAMLNWANFPKPISQLLWAQCANHATHLENIICKQNSKTVSELFHGQNPPWKKHLKIFGEVGIVHNHNKICSKLTDCGPPACSLAIHPIMNQTSISS